jgi:hypothetical protein
VVSLVASVVLRLLCLSCGCTACRHPNVEADIFRALHSLILRVNLWTLFSRLRTKSPDPTQLTFWAFIKDS